MFEALFQVLEGRCGIQPVSADTTPDGAQIIVLARQLGRADNFNVIMGQMLIAAAAANDWNLDISKWYTLKQSKPVYAWRFIFDGNLAAADARLTELVHAVPEPERIREVDVPLGVKTMDRNRPNGRGKGAGGINTHLVGPALRMQMGMGPGVGVR